MGIEQYTNYPLTVVTSGGTTAPSSGTVETWTVTSSTSFPGASTSAGTTFHVADPVAPTEMILVTNVSGTAWTVTRGAENSPTVAHIGGFTVQQVVTAGVLSSYLVFVQPSGDTSGVTDTANIQGPLTAGQRVRLAPGNFYVGAVSSTSAGLTVTGATNSTPGGFLEGSGPSVTKLFYVGSGVGIYSHGTQTGNQSYQGTGCTIRDLEIDGSMCPGGATVTGVSVGDQYDILLERVTVSNFTSTGTTGIAGTNPLGAIGFLVDNGTTLTEKLVMRQCVVNNCGTPNTSTTPNLGGGAAIQISSSATSLHGTGSTSHMYSDIDVHINQQGGQNGLVIASSGHLMNGRFTMRGNMQCIASNGAAAIVLGVGTGTGGSGHQAGHIQREYIEIHIELDNGTTSGSHPWDIYTGGNSDNTINRCFGRIQMLGDGSGNFQNTNLPLATDATFEFSGPLIGVTDLAVCPTYTPGASPWTLNYNGIDAFLCLKATGGSISAVTVNGVTIPSNSFAGPFYIAAGAAIVVTYTGTLAVTLVPAGVGY